MRLRHTPGKRDFYLSLTATLTGVAAFGSLAGTGYVVGSVTHKQNLEQQRHDEGATATSATAAPRSAKPPVLTILKRRPHRTVVQTQVIHRAPVSVSVGSGGTVSSAATTSQSGSSGYSGSTGGGGSSSNGTNAHAANPAPRPAAQPKPAPRPAPKPAPSAGS